MSYCDKCIQKYGDHLYLAFRVFLGLLFVQHGAQKLLGWFGGGGITGTAQYLGSLGFPATTFLAIVIGVIEFFGGLAIALGLFSRLAATFGIIDMLAAVFIAHVPNGGWLPIVNKGELALLYFTAFLVVLAYGNRKWSLEQALLKKEIF